MIKEISHEEYLKAPGVSKSMLDKIAISPAHLIASLEFPQEPTKAMEFGTLVHSAMFEPSKFLDSFIVEPDVDRRTEKYKKWKMAHEGELVLKKEDADTIVGMIDAMKRSIGWEVISGAKIEQSIFTNDPETTLRCKGRPDLMRDDCLVDYKTTDDASPVGFAKSIAQYRYHVQAAFYLDLCRWDGLSYDRFIFVAQEKRPPYAVGVYQIDEGSIEKGRELYRANLNYYAKCLSENKWPAYSNQVETISIPHWAF